MTSATPPRLRFAYADGAHGQVHYRSLGEGEPVVLLHWAPSNSRQYEHIMPELVRHGLRAIAVDVPGYGRSHKETSGWSCEQMAAEIAIALRDAGIERACVVGGHLSAAIAAELAIAAPVRWPKIVLDGAPTLTNEEMAHLMSGFAGLTPAWDAKGGKHKSFVWEMTERFLNEWDPDYHATPESLATHYAYMADYLQMGYAPIRAYVEPEKSPKGGLATYRALERWPLIPSKVLALTAEREALRAGHARGLALLRDAREHCFPGSHPIMNPARAAEYAGVVASFLRD